MTWIVRSQLVAHRARWQNWSKDQSKLVNTNTKLLLLSSVFIKSKKVRESSRARLTTICFYIYEIYSRFASDLFKLVSAFLIENKNCVVCYFTAASERPGVFSLNYIFAKRKSSLCMLCRCCCCSAKKLLLLIQNGDQLLTRARPSPVPPKYVFLCCC